MFIETKLEFVEEFEFLNKNKEYFYTTFVEPIYFNKDVDKYEGQYKLNNKVTYDLVVEELDFVICTSRGRYKSPLLTDSEYKTMFHHFYRNVFPDYVQKVKDMYQQVTNQEPI